MTILPLYRAYLSCYLGNRHGSFAPVAGCFIAVAYVPAVTDDWPTRAAASPAPGTKSSLVMGAAAGSATGREDSLSIIAARATTIRNG
jgi:hypothetical protein